MNNSFAAFKKQITNPVKFRLFMLTSLPAAFFAGLRVISLDENKSVIMVKQKWFNKNPFHSIYFAVLSMAAEVSTGVLCMGMIYKNNPPISMLVIKNESHFYKKATGKILFTCEDGAAIHNTIQQAISTKQGQTISCKTVGRNEQHEVVAEFYFVWSFKAKA